MGSSKDRFDLVEKAGASDTPGYTTTATINTVIPDKEVDKMAHAIDSYLGGNWEKVYADLQGYCDYFEKKQQVDDKEQWPMVEELTGILCARDLVRIIIIEPKGGYVYLAHGKMFDCAAIKQHAKVLIESVANQRAVQWLYYGLITRNDVLHKETIAKAVQVTLDFAYACTD